MQQNSCCLRYCKSTIFQANHNQHVLMVDILKLFAILQKYDFSSKSQLGQLRTPLAPVVCDTAKVRFFKQITTSRLVVATCQALFAILQKYDFSSKSQQVELNRLKRRRCLRYCKSTIFQANRNFCSRMLRTLSVVCDTAKVRFFKQITTC